jgi:hypothetical protein
MLSVLIVAVSAWGLLAGKLRHPLDDLGTGDLVVVPVLLAVLGLRFLPAFYAEAPSGADMTMHAYIARLVFAADGAPDSFRPILGIDTFPAFPIGFHVQLALDAMLRSILKEGAWLGEHILQASFALTAVSHWMVTVGVYALARRFSGWEASLAASLLCSFFLKNPQLMAHWGGNPTVLAVGLTAVFTALLITTMRVERPHGHIALASLILGGMLTTHTIVFVQSFYLLAPAVALAWIAARPSTLSTTLRRGFAGALIFLAVVSPFLMSIDPSAVSGDVIDWIENWVRETGHAWKGDVRDFIWTVPLYLKQNLFFSGGIFWILTFLSAVGAVQLFRSDRFGLILCLAFLASAVGLILNAQYWVLPVSYLIYPERVAVMAVLPLTVFVASGISWVASDLRKTSREIVFTVICVALLAGGAYYNEKAYVRSIKQESSLTANDLRVIRWIDRNVGRETTVLTNYGDGGAWIPALAGRTTTDPHINVAHSSLDREKPPADFAFVGEKCVYGCARSAAELQKDERYELMLRSGGAALFRIER